MVLKLPSSVMDEAQSQRENWAIFIKSLGGKVLADGVAREVKTKLSLPEEPEVFSIVEDHLTVQDRG